MTSRAPDESTLRPLIESAFEHRAEITTTNVDAALSTALNQCIELLDTDRALVAQKQDGRWDVNEWLKKAVLLYFLAHDNTVVDAGVTRFYDKVPLKYSNADEAELRTGGARVVPHAIARKGSFVAA